VIKPFHGSDFSSRFCVTLTRACVVHEIGHVSITSRKEARLDNLSNFATLFIYLPCAFSHERHCGHCPVLDSCFVQCSHGL